MRPREKFRVESVERAMPRIRREKLAVRVVHWGCCLGGTRLCSKMAAARGTAKDRTKMKRCVIGTNCPRLASNNVGGGG